MGRFRFSRRMMAAGTQIEGLFDDLRQFVVRQARRCPRCPRTRSQAWPRRWRRPRPPRSGGRGRRRRGSWPRGAGRRRRSGPPCWGLFRKKRRRRDARSRRKLSTMILRPVRPESPCGPPTTKRPVGLMKYLVFSSSSSAGTIGADDLFRSCRASICSCCDLRRVLGGDAPRPLRARRGRLHTPRSPAPCHPGRRYGHPAGLARLRQDAG